MCLITDLVFSVRTVRFGPRLGDNSREKMRILYVYPAKKSSTDKNFIKLKTKNEKQNEGVTREVLENL